MKIAKISNFQKNILAFERFIGNFDCHDCPMRQNGSKLHVFQNTHVKEHQHYSQKCLKKTNPVKIFNYGTKRFWKNSMKRPVVNFENSRMTYFRNRKILFISTKNFEEPSIGKSYSSKD